MLLKCIDVINKIAKLLENNYLSQQGAGNIIVSQGIKATACYGGLSYMHSISLSHKWTLDELHFSENILKWRSLNCKLAGVFRKQARLSTLERERTYT